MREGRVEPFLHAHPTCRVLQCAGACCRGLLHPACVIPRHEHVANFLHVVLRGSVKYEVLTRGKALQFGANPGTTFILPRGTIDELKWAGPTHRITVAIHPSLLVNAMDETAHESDVELTEHWNLTDPRIMAVGIRNAIANRTFRSWRGNVSEGGSGQPARAYGTSSACSGACASGRSDRAGAAGPCARSRRRAR
jgi:hypothetical protein